MTITLPALMSDLMAMINSKRIWSGCLMEKRMTTMMMICCVCLMSSKRLRGTSVLSGRLMRFLCMIRVKKKMMVLLKVDSIQRISSSSQVRLRI